MNVTVLFILFLVVAIAIFDVWVIYKKGTKESISAHLIRYSHKHPSLPFLLGFLCGHLFWRMSDVAVYGQ